MDKIPRKELWTQAIFDAQHQGKLITPPSTMFGELSLDEAYEVQAQVAERLEKAGKPQIGWKVGATSLAILEQMKGILDSPMYGVMTSDSICGRSGEISAAASTLGIEAEIGVIVDRPLKGPGITANDVQNASGSVVALVELLKTRYQENASLADGAADNSAHGGIVIGKKKLPISEFDFVGEDVVIKRNGSLWHTGTGAEVLGSPLNVVAWLANELGRKGRSIEAGQLVATGSLTTILTPEPGDIVDIAFANLGSMQLKIVD